jgi:hypothetical protein
MRDGRGGGRSPTARRTVASSVDVLGVQRRRGRQERAPWKRLNDGLPVADRLEGMGKLGRHGPDSGRVASAYQSRPGRRRTPGAGHERGGIGCAAATERARPCGADARLAAALPEGVADARSARGPVGVGARRPAGAWVRGGGGRAGAVRLVHDSGRLGAVCGVRVDASSRHRTVRVGCRGHRAGRRGLCRYDLAGLPVDGDRAHAVRGRVVCPARRIPYGVGVELPRQGGAGGFHLCGRVRADRRSAAQHPRDTEGKGLVLGRARGRGEGSRSDEPRHAGRWRRRGRPAARDAL